MSVYPRARWGSSVPVEETGAEAHLRYLLDTPREPLCRPLCLFVTIVRTGHEFYIQGEIESTLTGLSLDDAVLSALPLWDLVL